MEIPISSSFDPNLLMEKTPIVSSPLKERIGTWKLESVSIWTRWSDLHIINYRLREDCKHIAIGLFVICSLRQ